MFNEKESLGLLELRICGLALLPEGVTMAVQGNLKYSRDPHRDPMMCPQRVRALCWILFVEAPSCKALQKLSRYCNTGTSDLRDLGTRYRHPHSCLP